MWRREERASKTFRSRIHLGQEIAPKADEHCEYVTNKEDQVNGGNSRLLWKNMKRTQMMAPQ